MVIAIYSVFDKKSNHYQAPFFGLNDAQMLREFKIMLKNQKQRVENEYPEDFTIFRIGYFSDECGSIEGTAEPEKVVEVSSIVEKTYPPYSK